MLRPRAAKVRPFLALAMLACAAGAAGAQEGLRPPGDVPTLAQLFGQPAPQQQVNAGELIVRLNQLEGQLRQLNGQIEQLQFRNQQLEQSMRRMQEDYEFRFQELGGRPAARTGSPPAARPPGGAPPPPGQPPRRSDVFDPAADPTAPGAPRTLGSPGGPSLAAAPRVPDASQPVGVPGGRDPGQPLDLTTLAARVADEVPPPPRPPAPDLSQPAGPPPNTRLAGTPPPGTPPRNAAPGVLPPPTAAPGQQAALPPSTGTAREDYDRAYNAILRQDYDAAEGGFRLFLQAHGRDRLTPNATYWLGESLFQRQRWRDAAEHYLKVSTDYPNAQVAPNALLRLGQSLAALGEREAACATFGEAGRKYPTAPQSIRQSLDQEQRKARC